MAEVTKWDAGLYENRHSFVWKMAGDLVELLGPKPGEQILDVGCGTGQLTAKIAESGAQVIGIDQSAEMIRQAREQFPAIRFEVGDARQLALVETFDAVFSNAALHWVKEADQVARAIRHRLRPGGRFVAEFGGQGNIAGLLAAVEKAWNKLGIARRFVNPWYYPSLGEYAALLENHGFEVTYATLFDRPTTLEEGERGLRNWLEMFGASILKRLPAEVRERALQEVQSAARPALWREGSWVLDYRRLRVVARNT